MGLELTFENVELVLDEIRPYLMAGAELLLRCSDQLLPCCGTYKSAEACLLEHFS